MHQFTGACSTNVDSTTAQPGRVEEVHVVEHDDCRSSPLLENRGETGDERRPEVRFGSGQRFSETSSTPSIRSSTRTR